ncbi:MAG: hypothetical protein WC472_00765 [Candidatus Paceibacterota bacterium]
MTNVKPYCILGIQGENGQGMSYLLFYVRSDEVGELSTFNQKTEIFRFSGDSDIFKKLGIDTTKRKANVMLSENPNGLLDCVIESYKSDGEIFGRVEFRAIPPSKF